MGYGAALPPGTTFANDYRVVRPLASGGMGTVYVAEQLSTGKQRALKLMHAELAWDARLRERFVQEARVGANIDSEHVVEVVGAGIDQATGTPWLAMEMLDGLDLAAMVEQRGPLPVGEVREIMSQLCHALAAAHRSGIVHRDLKPQNIFVARSRQQNVTFKVKVLDFGIAKVVAAARGTSAATSVVGTPLWMAPEQTDPNGFVSPACDVWALGLIAFRLLTARWYWAQAVGEASSVMTLMREVLFEPIVPASARAAQFGVAHLVPPGFDAWFARCLERDHRARFQDAAQAVQALNAALGGSALEMQSGIHSPPMQSSPMQSSPMHPSPMQLSPMGATGPGAVLAHTPSPQFDTSHTNGAMGVPAPAAKRRVAPWVWMVGGVSAVMAMAGLIVVVLALFAVGIDAANDGTVSSTASSRDVSGSYAITDGSNPGGAGRYNGTVHIQRTNSTYQVHWALTAGPDYRGIGLVSGDLFGVGYAQGGDYAVAIYRLEGGVLRGSYTQASTPGRVGTEVLQGPAGLSGTYRVTQSADGLTGEVTIQPNGSTYSLVRSASAGGHQGTGIRRGDQLVVTWTPTVMVGGVVAYEIRSSVLDGKWAPMKSTMLGTEILTIQ